MKNLSSPIESLLHSIEERASHTALIYGNRRLDYAELGNRISCLVSALQEQGVAPGESIASLTDPFETLLLALAAHLTGCTLFPLNPHLPQSSLESCSKAATTRLIYTGIAPSDLATVEMISSEALFNVSNDDCLSLRKRAETLGLDDTHLMIATGGSTSSPRVVRLNGHNIMAGVTASRRRLKTTADDIFLCCLPLFHIGGLAMIYRTIEAGGTLVLHDGFQIDSIIKDMETYQATQISLVPTMLSSLVQQQYQPPKSLRVALIGGSPLSEALYNEAISAGWPLIPTYGMTENASQIATLDPGANKWHPGLVGEPLEHTEVSIMNRSVNGIGSIRIRGESVMQGQLSTNGTTSDYPNGEWFETGDIGTLDDDGNLTILGRSDNLLISGGENVYPEQLESLLLQHPLVQDVGVTGKKDIHWGEIVIALYSGDIEEDALEIWCRTKLNGAWLPKRFTRVAQIPRTSMRKIDRKALAKLIRDS